MFSVILIYNAVQQQYCGEGRINRVELTARPNTFFSTVAILERFQELLSNLVFEDCWSCGDLVWVGNFNSIFERDASDNFGEIVKAA